jgi:hypothetical protein
MKIEREFKAVVIFTDRIPHLSEHYQGQIYANVNGNVSISTDVIEPRA